MKFKHYLETIAGIEIFPLISLIVFVVFFFLLLIYVMKADKTFISDMKNIPLRNEVDDDSSMVSTSSNS